MVQKLKVKTASELEDEHKLIWQKEGFIFPIRHAWHVSYVWLHLKTAYCKTFLSTESNKFKYWMSPWQSKKRHELYNGKLIPHYKLFSHISLCPRPINLHYIAAATSCFIFYRQLLSNIMRYMPTDFAILSYLINHSAPVNILSWQMVSSEKVQHTDFFSSEVLK